MSTVKFETVTMPVFEPKDPETCVHSWSWYTYALNGIVTSKKLCFYCKTVENA